MQDCEVYSHCGMPSELSGYFIQSLTLRKQTDKLYFSGKECNILTSYSFSKLLTGCTLLPVSSIL